MRKYGPLALCLVLLVCVAAGAAEPPTAEDMQTTIQQLKARLAALEEQVAAQKLQGNAPAFKAVAEDAAGRSALPSWLDNFKMFGDLRLRHESRCNASWAKNRHQARFRLRFGARKYWLDEQMELYFRLASGNNDVPTSTNQTFDNSFSKKPVWIDRVYAKYKPKWLKGSTIMGGKFGPPMVHTDLVWDADVNVEGVWAQYKPEFGPFAPFVNAGYFIVEENWLGDDSILVAYQVGTDVKLGKDTKLTFAGTYYDYDHYESQYRYAFGNDVVGGMLAAEEFETVNLTTKVSFKLLGLPMSAYFDYVYNCGETDPNWLWQDQDKGCAAGFNVGQNKKKGDWSAGYKYAHIQANATAGFNDADFGSTNSKGHVIKAQYNITDWLTFGCAVYYVEGIAGPRENLRTVVVQADLIWKF